MKNLNIYNLLLKNWVSVALVFLVLFLIVKFKTLITRAFSGWFGKDTMQYKQAADEVKNAVQQAYYFLADGTRLTPQRLEQDSNELAANLGTGIWWQWWENDKAVADIIVKHTSLSYVKLREHYETRYNSDLSVDINTQLDNDQLIRIKHIIS